MPRQGPALTRPQSARPSPRRAACTTAEDPGSRSGSARGLTGAAVDSARHAPSRGDTASSAWRWRRYRAQHLPVAVAPSAHQDGAETSRSSSERLGVRPPGAAGRGGYRTRMRRSRSTPSPTAPAQADCACALRARRLCHSAHVPSDYACAAAGRWRRRERRGAVGRPYSMRNLRLLRAGGRRPAAPLGTPQCFCLSAEPGRVLVGSQHGVLELGPAGASVRAAGRTRIRGLLSLSRSGQGCGFGGGRVLVPSALAHRWFGPPAKGE